MITQPLKRTLFWPFLLTTLLLIVSGCNSQPAPSQSQPFQPNILNSKDKNDAILLIKGTKESISLARSELFERKDLSVVEIASDPAYSNRPTRYQAILFRDLIQGLVEKEGSQKNDSLQFISADGFASSIELQSLVNSSNQLPIAYLAIEPNDAPWPKLKEGHSGTAGPFYLVWKLPAGAHPSAEQWPFQITEVRFKKSLAQTYPRLFPSGNLSHGHPANRGVHVYLKNCFPCHKLNQEGIGSIGPDLNYPMSPIEYFKSEAILKKFIRNPQSVRVFQNDLMRGFPPEELPESELNDLIQYLKLMKEKRPKSDGLNSGVNPHQ